MSEDEINEVRKEVEAACTDCAFGAPAARLLKVLDELVRENFELKERIAISEGPGCCHG